MALARVGRLAEHYLGIPSEVWTLETQSLGTLTTLHRPYIHSAAIYCTAFHRFGMTWNEVTDETPAGNMAVDKITPNDSRIKHEYAEVAGRRWRTHSVVGYH